MIIFSARNQAWLRREDIDYTDISISDLKDAYYDGWNDCMNYFKGVLDGKD